jgi:hypothetical protein
MNLGAIFIGSIIALACTTAICQSENSSVLSAMDKSGFFSKNKNRESNASVIFSIEQAISKGGNIAETDGFGNSPLGNVMAFAVTHADGVDANPILKAIIRLGADVNRPIGPKAEEIYPLCFPFLWGTFNNEVVHILLNAGASRTIKCNGMTLIEVAQQQALNPKLVEILQNHR